MDGAREMVRALAQEGQTGGESVREVEGRRSRGGTEEHCGGLVGGES